MLEVQRISKTFNAGTVNEKKAIQNLSLTLRDGEFATIVGSIGAGKSTLFNAIAGTFYVDQGSVTLNGADITFLPEHKRSSSSSGVTIVAISSVSACRCPPESRPTGVFIRSSSPISSSRSFSRNSSRSFFVTRLNRDPRRAVRKYATARFSSIVICGAVPLSGS